MGESEPVQRRVRDDSELSTGASFLWTLLYLAAVGFLASRHVLWRDEVRAINIAGASHSLGELVFYLHNEGHPAIWYLLLYAAIHGAGTSAVVKPLSLAIAGVSVFLVLRFSPFARWQKAVFATGLFPLFEYSVMCRNYGVSMLLLFALAMLYKSRYTRPVRFAVVLGLLANTNAFAFVIVLAFTLALLVEGWNTRRARVRAGRLATLLSFGLVLVGICCAGAVMAPDGQSTAILSHDKHSSALVTKLGMALLLPTHFLFATDPEGHVSLLLAVLGAGASILTTIVAWLVAVYFWPNRGLTFTWLASLVGFSLMNDLVYRGSARHWGLIYILLLTLLWAKARDCEENEAGAPRLVRMRWVRWSLARHRAAFACLLGVQTVLAVVPVTEELLGVRSSSRSLGAFITRRPDLAGAILIGEPDYLLEALPYYASNRIYLVREGTYMVKIHFTEANRAALSLDELMAAADRLQRETGEEVLIVMGHSLAEGGPFTFKLPFHHEFTYTSASLEEFLSRATLLARFDGATTDENYTLYRWSQRKRLS
jgi:hypothetical protein